MWGAEPEMASLSRLMIDALPQPSDRFSGGGLFLDPTHAVSPSLVSLISPERRRFPVRRLGFGGGGGRSFMSVSLSVKKRDSGDVAAEEEDEEGYDRDSGEFRGRNGNIAVKKVNAKSSGAFNMTKHLWAGAISAMVSRTFVAPLERLKLEYIVRGEQRKLAELIGAIAASQGLVGFWKGNFVNILRTAPFKAINFYAYDTYRDRLMKISGRDETTNFERFLAGAAAGVTATVLCIPMDTIRTVMVAPGGEALGGLVGTFQHMIRTEGFLSLYKGLGPSIVSMAPSGAVFYGVYDVLKSAYLRSPEGRRRSDGIAESETGELSAFEQLELGPVRTLVYGAIAGLCAEAATYPFEVVRRQLQMQSGPTKMTALSTCLKIVHQGGLPALYVGVLPSLLQVLPSAAISYFVYEFMKIVLKVESA